MKRVLGFFLLVAFVTTPLYCLAHLLDKPEEITQTIAEEVIVTEGVTVVAIKQEPAQFRRFDSEEELAEFLEKDDTDSVIRFTGGIVVFADYDCDDYAQALQIRALEQGFLMSVELIIDGKIFGVKVSEFTGRHMGNLTVIGNDIYYIEPSTDEFCLVTALD